MEANEIIGEGGALNAGWTDTLPEDIRGNEAFADVKTIGDLASGYVNKPSALSLVKSGLPDAKWHEKYQDDAGLFNGIQSAQEMLGKRGDIPSENSTPEQVQEFWNKQGMAEFEVKATEFGEEYGDDALGLNEMYGSIAGKIGTIVKEESGKSKNMSELVQNVVSRYIAEDSKALLESGVTAKQETQVALGKRFDEVARVNNLTHDQLVNKANEVMGRYGFDGNTPAEQLLLTISQATDGGLSFKGGALNTTSEGIDTQLEALRPQLAVGTQAERTNASKQIIALLEKKGTMK